MKNHDLENRKEDYLVKTKITRYLENGEKDSYPVENVLCKVYLPVKVTDSVLLIFHLTEEQYKIFDTDIFLHFAVESVEDLPEHYVPHHTTHISAENVYFKNLTNTHWGFGISETRLIAEPIDLKIEHFRSPDGVDIPKTFGRFWLTPNKLISPGQSRSTSHTGEVKFDTVWNVDFTLESGLNLNFTKRHRYRNGDDDGYISWSELVANYELEGKAQGFDDVYNSLADLDDFLKISSLAVRHSCVCIGFDIVNTDGYILEFYRRNIAFSPTTETRYDELIDIGNIKEFLDTTYKKFIELDRNDLLRQAIIYTIPRKNRTVENSFISLYSALETLVLYFRRNANLEFVFAEEENQLWKEFDKDLRIFIKEHPVLSNDKTKRKRLYDNIPALKRISFKVAFEECFKFYEIDISDLWSVNDNNEGWSLSTIRNKLVHGEHFDSSRRYSIALAKLHLQWIVERLLLIILGWDISKSNVNSESVNRIIYNNEDWKVARKLLSE